MNRNLPLLVAIMAILHAIIAASSFVVIVLAEETHLSIFSGLVRSLVFSDVPIYFEYANKAFDGKLPYRDFVIEYPPLALPFLFGPRLFTATQSRFVAIFAGEMLLFHSILIGAVARQIQIREGLAAVEKRLFWMTAAFVGVAPFVMGRFDAVPSLVGFVAATSLYGNREKLGGFLAGIGALIKIVPGVTALPAITSLVGAGTHRKWRGSAAFLMTMFVGVVAWFAFSGAGAMQAIRYHADRGVELGSLPAGAVALVGKLAGARVVAEFDARSKSQNVFWEPWSTYAARCGLPFQAVLLGLVALRYLQVGKSDPVRFAGAAVLAFAIGGKVFSPQYLLWFLPFATVLTGRAGKWGRPLFLFASFATMVLYPWAFLTLSQLVTWTVVLLNLRNLALLLLLGVMLIGPDRVPGDAV